jgi:hypothetical protein
MTSAQPGRLAFQETMRGPFSLGAVDPANGAASGRAARTALTMRAAVSIADVASFAHDPSHTATLGGHVMFDPLGDPMPAVSGVVRLFAPRDDTQGVNRKVMYYGLRLARGARELFLAGQKNVDGRSLFSLWGDTTTLYTTLYDGPDDRAPVIGAGVLRLSPMDFLRTLPTLRPARPATLARFGGFFVSELWNSYARRL